MEKPKIILFAPYNLLSHYLRCIQLAKSINHEYDTVFLYSSKYNHIVKQNGFKISGKFTPEYKTVVEKAESFDFSWINVDSIRKTVNNFGSIFKGEKPDLIIGDSYLGLRIAAEYCNIPLLCVLNAYISPYYQDFRDVPHNHPGNKYKRFVNAKVWRKLVVAIESIAFKKEHQPFKELREELGLVKLNNLLDEFAGDYNIICDDSKVFPLKELPDNYFKLNPILYESNKNETELIKLIDNNKQTIYVSAGSSGYSLIPDFISPDMLSNYNIIVTGAERNYFEHGIIYRNFVNFNAIADKIDLTICHGGNGTLYQSAQRAIPIIAIPRIFEQEWNTQRFQKLGLCEVFYRENPAEELLKLIREMLANKKKVKKTAINTYSKADFCNLLNEINF